MILFKDGKEIWGGGSIEVKKTFTAGEKASYVLVAQGSGSAVFDFDIAAPGADVSLKGLYLCDGNDRVDVRVNMLHSCGGSVSDQLFRGVVSGHARAFFDGKITVAPQAQKTEAYQNCRNLLLSDDAIAQSLPQLEIYADDVKCSHGATCGSLDEDEQFYMRSRGISEAQARRLQIISFLSAVLEELPEDSQVKKDILLCL